MLLQDGHNDMKPIEAAAYKSGLPRLAAAATQAGGRVVLVTPMHRRTFQGKTVVNSHKGFPDAVRELVREEGLPLIDLHALSKTLYEALGPDGPGALFKAGGGTHHSPYGAYELARCVEEGVWQSKLDLAKLLADDLQPFDPARPDPFDRFRLPASASARSQAPRGWRAGEKGWCRRPLAARRQRRHRPDGPFLGRKRGGPTA
jgi:hypothetical protein